MKRLALFVAVFGSGCLLAGTVLLLVSPDLTFIRRALQAIGSYSYTAPMILGTLRASLIIAGLLLLATGLIFFLADRRLDKASVSSRRLFLMLFIGIQVTIGAVYIAILPYQADPGDDAWYYLQANNLATGSPIVWNHSGATPVNGEPTTYWPFAFKGESTAYWPIGYPVILSMLFRIFGSHIWVGQILNLILLAGITLISYFLARDLLGPPTAWRTGLVVALIPSLILISPAILSDLFFTFLLLLLLFLAHRKRRALIVLLMGIVYGLTLLTRPVAFFLPVLLSLYWFLKDRRLKNSLVHMVIILIVGELVLLPWQIHNFRAFGQFVAFSNNGGHNFWMGNNPYTPCHGPQATFIAGEDTLEMMKSLNEAQRYSLMFKIGLQYALSHPLKTVLVWPKKLFFLYFKDSQAISWAIRSCPDKIPPPVLGGLYIFTDGFYYSLGLTFFLSFMGMWRKERFSPRIVLVIGLLVCFSAIFLPFITECRYHLPLLPILAIFAVHKPDAAIMNSVGENPPG